MTWEELFDRAAAYDVTEDDVSTTVDAVRTAAKRTDDDTEADD